MAIAEQIVNRHEPKKTTTPAGKPPAPPPRDMAPRTVNRKKIKAARKMSKKNRTRR